LFELHETWNGKENALLENSILKKSAKIKGSGFDSKFPITFVERSL
jgi:hypothetical protein